MSMKTMLKGIERLVVGLSLAITASLAADSGPSCTLSTNLTASLNQWTTLSYHRGYNNNIACGWLIYAGDPNYSLQVEWHLVNIEYSLGCEKDFVQIYRGFNRAGELLDHRCGRSTINVNNIGRYAYIYFQTDETNTRDGFSLKYKSTNSGAQICTSTTSLTAHPYSWQTFASPYYPDLYLDGLSCNWLITTDDPMEVVRLEFVDADIQYSDDCTNDVISIYDGGIPNSLFSMGQLCKNTTPSFVSTGRKMYMTFKTDSSIQARGFKVRFISQLRRGNCSGITEVTAYSFKKQYLTTPNYPHFYANNLSCSWLIKAGRRTGKLYLNVRDSDIEYSLGCMKDYAEVYLGPSRTADIFSRWCGGTRRKFYTYHKRLFIHFHTDSSLSGRGFKLAYYMGSPPDACSTTIRLTTAVHNEWKNFSSPFYPTVYEGNLSCSWLIQAMNLKDVIEVEVLDFEVEDSPGCVYDSVSIYDGTNEKSSRLDRWCGTRRPSFISTSNSLFVRLVTDDSYDYRGFRMRYIARDVSYMCGRGKYLQAETEIRKYLVSPNLISPLYRTITCEWGIHAASVDEVVRLEVVFSSLDNSSMCQNNFIAVYDGTGIYRKLMGKVCGNKTQVFTSNGTKMYVMMQLGSANTSNAFLATYMSRTKGVVFINLSAAECFGVEYLETSLDKKSYINSPDFPQFYKSPMPCTWLITAGEDQIIKLEVTFSEFSNCRKTFLAVYDGNSRRDAVLGQMCSNSSFTFTSSGPSMMALLQTDGDSGPARFLATYTAEQKSEECLRLESLQAQRSVRNYFQTPNFPDPYRSTSRCYWFISADGPKDVINLEIIYSNLVETAGCSKESISVHETKVKDMSRLSDSARSTELLGVTCDNKHKVYISNERYMYVIFKTNLINGSKGFLAAYTSITDYKAEGSGVFLVSAQKGDEYIHTPNFPRPYHRKMSTSWLIKAEDDRQVVRVDVAFSDIKNTDDCVIDYAAAFDGTSEDSKRLAKWCGSTTPSFKSSGSEILVVFHTNSSDGNTGFLASYHSEGSAPGSSTSGSSFTSTHIWLCITLLIFLIIMACGLLVRYLLRKHRRPRRSGSQDTATESIMGSADGIHDPYRSTTVSMKSLLDAS